MHYIPSPTFLEDYQLKGRAESYIDEQLKQNKLVIEKVAAERGTKVTSINPLFRDIITYDYPQLNPEGRRISCSLIGEKYELENGKSFYLLSSQVIGDMILAMQPVKTESAEYEGILAYQMAAIEALKTKIDTAIPILSICSLDMADLEISTAFAANRGVILDAVREMLPIPELIGHIVILKNKTFTYLVQRIIALSTITRGSDVRQYLSKMTFVPLEQAFHTTSLRLQVRDFLTDAKLV